MKSHGFKLGSYSFTCTKLIILKSFRFHYYMYACRCTHTHLSLPPHSAVHMLHVVWI